jgi:hypothetical protein
MTKEKLFKQYNIEYNPELWEDETVEQIRKWIKWFSYLRK